MELRSRIARKNSGFTLLEIVVSMSILAMIALLIYGAFTSMSRGKKGEEIKSERARVGRTAILRMTREISSAFISMHTPSNPALIIRLTTFTSVNSQPFDRLDFTSFAHRRISADTPESDQAEIGYFVTPDPDKTDKMDLVRREQSPIDLDPRRGGQTNVMCEDVESLNFRFFDPLTWAWVDSWDSLQVNGQPNRLPYEVEITLVLAHVPPGVDSRFVTKLQMPTQQPLTFGIPR
ncbi:MAG: type II secretion system protein GspJ [Polyangiaceae bacterium]